MPKIIFDRATGQYVGGVRHGEPAFDRATQVVVDLEDFPADPDAVRWDGQRGVRAATAKEVADALPPDVRAFEFALRMIYAEDLLGMNTLLAKYPLFMWALRGEDWAAVGAILGAAILLGDIRAQDVAAVRQAIQDAHLPVTLP